MSSNLCPQLQEEGENSSPYCRILLRQTSANTNLMLSLSTLKSLLFCLPLLTPNRPLQTAAPSWAWLCQKLLPVKREFFLPTVAKYLLKDSNLIFGLFCIIVGSYSKKHLEVAAVVIAVLYKWNWIEKRSKHKMEGTEFGIQKGI